MSRIAVIFESSPFDRKGLFNSVHQRIRHLLATGECEIDAYCIHSRDTVLTRKMRHTPEVPDVETVTVDGITYRVLWYQFSIIDHILVNKLHCQPLFFNRFMSSDVGLLKGYDCILAHSFTGALFARGASDRYGMPYFVTWHGSDVHSHPWRNPLVLAATRSLMEEAACNFFVSNALLENSHRITTSARKEVLYNGVSDAFVRFDVEERMALRRKYGLAEGEKVVAFVGSIVAVKNVHALQPIFSGIRARYGGALKFWMVGDGKLRSQVENAMSADNSIDVRFWGNVAADEIPSIMNCIDLLVLPSLNEGLPLVCAEAMRCGASVIGSDVGGISEVIGKDNTVPLGDGFVEELSEKAFGMLRTPAIQEIPSQLDWKATAAKELTFILPVL